MSYLETNPMKNSSIMWLYTERDKIQTDPDYQRNGGVWTLSKRQLLIDSILNDYDLPKLYLHELTVENGQDFQYAIIDGRQRLETIWQFMDDAFKLADDLEFKRSPDIILRGKKYSELASEFPRIKVKFDSFSLPIVLVRTEDDELELIEEMFSRLNEASPLNAAEKRNALNGVFVEFINRISGHKFFSEKVKFGNQRYQHKEVAARILLTEYSIQTNLKLIDTKKVFLDDLAGDKYVPRELAEQITEEVVEVLDQLCSIFENEDNALSAQGLMVVYYLLARKAIFQNETDLITRSKLIEFREALTENRKAAEENMENSIFDYLEFDRLNQQGTNDASSIRERTRILSEYLGISDPQVVIIADMI